jgi:hypothetical protein
MNAERHAAERKQSHLLRHIAVCFRWDGLLARLDAAVATLAPLGYQDETGFHFGMEYCLIPLPAGLD